jgi:hypothetical protein
MYLNDQFEHVAFMNATQFETLLYELRACSETRKWAKGKDLKTVWDTCERGDWLLWLAGRMADKPGWATRKAIVSAACDCAELAIPYVQAGEARPAGCIRVVRAWVRGEATIEQVREAQKASRAAAAAADYTASAAASACTAAAAAAARMKVLQQCADIARKALRPDGI